MKTAAWLREVLEIGGPWEIAEVSCDSGRRQVDVWVGMAPERKGWLFRAKSAATDARERVWRHVNLGAWRCYVHLQAGADSVVGALPWCGDDDMPFTRALSRQIAALLSEGIKFPTICILLDVQPTELWKFKYSLDSGRTGLGAAAPHSVPPAHGAPPLATSAAGLPDFADPVWESLLDGSVDIDIRVLSLKLLLTKLREQMRVIRDPDVKMLKKHEVYRYFVRHEKVLGHELTQLRGS